MSQLSVVIITLNEEKNIGRCLQSVINLADEIVVVDSGSTDKTAEICNGYGARFIVQPFLGYIGQKNFALEIALHPHVLSLDADEALSPELKNAIMTEKNKGFPATGYSMNRLSWFCDNWIRHGTWYPDKKLRLILKNCARWGGTNPHDKLELKAGSVEKHLRGDLLHYTYYSLEEYISQGNKFSSIAANAMSEQGKKAGYVNLVWNPFMAFVKSYILRAGFLDGFNGYVIARQSANQTFQKYAKLIQLLRMQETKS
jgi:glycosyltransferase involved in cell wall biosynthesis